MKEQSLFTSSNTTKEETPVHLVEYMKFMERIMSGEGPEIFNYKNEDVEFDEETDSNSISFTGEGLTEIGQQIATLIQNLNIDNSDKNYLLKLGYRESRLIPTARAPGSSYRGLYQFNDDSLKTIGINPKEYDADPIVQIKAALLHKQYNLNLLKRYHKLIGDEYQGIRITANGMAAASALLGAGSVMDWFDDTRKTIWAKRGFVDGNGTSIKEYFRLFEND